MSEVDKTKRINDLNTKLSVLREQRENIISETDSLQEKRDVLNAKVRNLKEEAKRLKQQRDELNQKIKQQKQKRNDLTSMAHDKIDEARLLISATNTAKEKTVRGAESLQHEIEDIEWRIQTSSLPLSEEKELVEKVRDLETQLNVHRKLQRTIAKRQQLSRQIYDLKTRSREVHENLIQEAQKSQQIHQFFVTKIEEIEKAKVEADMFHRQFLEMKAKATPIQQETLAISNQIKLLKGELLKEKLVKKEQDEKTARENLEKKAREKIKRREKLDWEEFKALGEKGITEQDRDKVKVA